MNKYMTKDWKIKNGKCDVCKQNELQSRYEEILKQFPKGAIFLVVSYMEKGYIYILPEYEELAKQLLGDDLDLLERYEGEDRTEQYVNESLITNHVEYSFISYMDGEIFDGAFGDETRTCQRCKSLIIIDAWTTISLYYAFKNLGLLVLDDPILQIRRDAEARRKMGNP